MPQSFVRRLAVCAILVSYLSVPPGMLAHTWIYSTFPGTPELALAHLSEWGALLFALAGMVLGSFAYAAAPARSPARSAATRAIVISGVIWIWLIAIALARSNW